MNWKPEADLLWAESHSNGAKKSEYPIFFPYKSRRLSDISQSAVFLFTNIPRHFIAQRAVSQI